MASSTLGTDELSGCPHCGSPLHVASGRPSIHEPLGQCANCGGLVIRQGTNEWDLMKGGQRVAHLVRHAFLALTMGLALPLLYLAVEVGSGRSWQLRYALLSLGAGWILAGAWQGSRLAAKIQRSRRRMGDPMYLAKLVEYEMAATSRR
jgi:hypothetical protein